MAASIARPPSFAIQSPLHRLPLQHASSTLQLRNRPSSGLIGSSSSQEWRSAASAFIGQVKWLAGSVWSIGSGGTSSVRPMAVMFKPIIQFIKGVDERTVPDVSLTKSRDGTNGMATFLFDQPSIFDSSRDLGDITGLYLIDEEGMLQSIDVTAKFVNGKPAKIVAKYIMRNSREWDRFMRFMERYAEANGLGFIKK